MRSTFMQILGGVAVLGLALPSLAAAQVQNLRITEINPQTGFVEVTNTGPAFMTISSHPFCHRFNYFSSVPASLPFAAGGVTVVPVTGLNATDSDMWLYSQPVFPVGSNMIHGLKYGPQSNVGRTPLATSEGLWPSASAYVNTPPPGMTLSWDGFGFDPLDWYIDETPSLGAVDATSPGTVPQSLLFPGGIQDFENTKLGDEVIAVQNWELTSTSATDGIFTVRTVNDVLGSIAPRSGSAQWLRVRDQDAGNVQNQFCTPTIAAQSEDNYTWTFWLNLEQTPPGGSASRPRIMVQHPDPVFTDAWGLRLNPTRVVLFVSAYGGPAAAVALYDITGATGLGQWVKVDLSVDFANNMVSASANDGTPVSLPIALDAAANKKQSRLCYIGDGSGNVMTMLIDDVAVDVHDTSVPVAFQRIDATVSGREVTVAWDVFADEAMSGFQVYRSEAGRQGEAQLNADLLPVDARKFTDDTAAFGKRYHYVVGVRLPDGSEIRSAAATVDISPLIVTLRQNFPNPFNPSTTIGYTLSHAGAVKLEIFDVGGRRVAAVASGYRDAGPHTAAWNGRDANGNPVSAGIYFYRLTTGGEVLTRKMVLIR